MVELRTSSGPVYAQPSFWERLYLLWIFRNFRCLPKEVLAPNQRRLIEKLGRTAISQPSVAPRDLIGIVENVQLLRVPKPEVVPAPSNVIEMVTSTAEIAVPRAAAAGGAPMRWEPPAERSVARMSPTAAKVEAISSPGNSSLSEPRNGHKDLIAPGVVRTRASKRSIAWILAAASLVAAVGVLLRLPTQARPLPPVTASQPAIPEAPPPAASAPATTVALPAAVLRTATSEPVRPAVIAEPDPVNGPALLPQPKPHSTDHEAASASVASPVVAEDDSSQESRLQIAQPPESGFRYPEAPASSLTGRVSLKAIIGTDGAIRRVDILSGNHALAVAAVQAVKHWRYPAPELDGHAVEAETTIAINFRGDDAVSVTFPAAR